MFLFEYFLAAFVLLVIWIIMRPKKNLPPGEYGWPVIGYIPPPYEPMRDTIYRLQKKYGDLFTLKFGSWTQIMICDWATLKSVLNHADVTERPAFFSFKAITDNKLSGIFNTSGEIWQHSRRFTMRHLRDLGLGKSSLEASIAFEAAALVEEMEKCTDGPTVINFSLSLAVLNVLWKMVSDIRFKLNDPAAQRFQTDVLDLFDEFQGNVKYFDQFPFLETIVPKFLYKALGISGLVSASEKLNKYIKDVIEDHKKNLDENNPKDFIDEFLIEIKKNGGEGSAFTEQNMEGIIVDLFTAGGETTTSTIRWILFYLAKYPEIQEKIQREIDEVVPRDRLPSLDDQKKLNYTEAVFHEVQRLVSLTPLTFARHASKTIEVNGYKIPKDTLIMGHVEGCHRSPDYWARPDDFYPEHFLDENGKFVLKKEGYAPFSLGRRICPGESVAKLNIYLFTTALLQNFIFAPAPSETFIVKRDPNQPFFNGPNHTLKYIITKRK